MEIFSFGDQLTLMILRLIGKFGRLTIICFDWQEMVNEICLS